MQRITAINLIIQSTYKYFLDIILEVKINSPTKFYIIYLIDYKCWFNDGLTQWNM